MQAKAHMETEKEKQILFFALLSNLVTTWSCLVGVPLGHLALLPPCIDNESSVECNPASLSVT